MKALRFLFLFSVCVPVFAADVGYEVEVILFEDTTGVYNNVENWEATENTLRQAQQEADTETSETATKAKKGEYTLLKPDRFRLNKQAQRLVDHPDYNILLHTAWKQPGLDKPEAFAVPVNTASENDTSYITGSITLVMSRYLHIHADMHYYKPTPAITPSINFSDQSVPTTATGTPMQSYPVMFERRMRSRETHYIDHPMVGMIILATPFKIEPDDAPKKPAKGYRTL